MFHFFFIICSLESFSDESSSSSSDSSREEIGLRFFEGAREYFVHDGNVYSLYKSILFREEKVSRSVFSRPLNCGIFLLEAGHFAGAVFNGYY